MANIDKDNGVIYFIRVNKKPDLMGQSVYNLIEISVWLIFLWGLSAVEHWAGQISQHAGLSCYIWRPRG